MIHVFNFGDAMFFGSKVGEGIELESLVKDLVPKCWFLDLDEKEVDNVIKGSRKVSKLVELWAKNAFDEWSFSWF